jgi:prepilin-type N-terminal cleavage/methylation domain-containing protein
MNVKQFGFTLIELLVVIAIIGLLASVVVGNLTDARQAAQIARAQQELRSTMLGVQMLITDTGKAPNGCPRNAIANPEVSLQDPRAGLLFAPSVGSNSGGCEWTAADVAAWSGPYIPAATDPWGNGYWYDPDYIPYRNCPTFPEEGVIQAVVTRGFDGAWYTCDDAFLELR